MTTGSAFSDGEVCLLSDKRGRKHLVTLSAGNRFQYHKGTVDHDVIIGSHEGVVVMTSKGTALIALRPRLADYVLHMKRGAAVMYPKDTGPLITWADIAPGCRVVEAGTGSGALTLALSRAVGESGRVISVERRDDHARHASKIIAAFAGGIPANVDLRIGEVEQVIQEVEPDRIVLDLPEPWHSIGPAAMALVSGGSIASYLPTVPQVQTFREELGAARIFTEIETFEIMMRTWTFEGRSVRPDHRMIGHTGFITVARKRIGGTARVE